ncbi:MULTISPECIES: hypothetical protein [Vibrio oreintalis group]|uniref:Uncharacterized protein n=1 Tax=Vibrio europaeus TaxID=300876 RepID=A0ABT5H2B6_9VIBR|nr:MULTISPECIES: hypothetical protein [Vibrio oreintalis group]MCG9583667.1 hypothetical protein [Vibrio tubiashii]MCG9617245.1 hypothetical protein [Vibrio tubiashii]MCG9687073.1 hypothetical protein [Vibrio tubiashii]MDC5706609.1 hypothetical protein [Vibrio europaeus]MDC5711858.1 hypothetical protein [Vibrio europaeus]
MPIIRLTSNYIADGVSQSLEHHQTLSVVAYEGVGKGAMAHRNTPH